MFMGQDGFVWWIGVVEDNNDPLLIGRAKVRIFGYHPSYNSTEANYSDVQTNKVAIEDLPWASPIMPLNFSNAYGKVALGEWVFGFFLDGKDAQEPVMIGYLPAAYRQTNPNFGKHATSRSFADIEGPIADGPYTGSDFSAKSNRFEWHTPANHHIRISDESTSTTAQEFSLVHAAGNFYVSMTTTNAGVSRLTLHHPSGTYIQLTNDDITVNSSRGAYSLIDQLNWISLQTHSTLNGDSFTIGVRPPPPPPPRRRRGCFTQDSLILMQDGKTKRIVDVQIGDKVLSKDRMTYNTVRFIEKVDTKSYKHLYSPTIHLKPFATLDHPIYYDDKLWAVNPELTNRLYPWLGKIDSLENYYIEDNEEEYVYNLWVTGDGSYIVNNYATTSIIFDGGMLCDQLEKGYLSKEEVQSLYTDYTTRGLVLLHGSYLLNYLIGKLKSDRLNYIVSVLAKKPFYHPFRWIITGSMLAISVVAHMTSFLHKWRFRNE